MDCKTVVAFTLQVFIDIDIDIIWGYIHGIKVEIASFSLIFVNI